MSRFLHRPMFRRGGSAGEGITSGLRPGYNRGKVVIGEDFNIFESEDERKKRFENLYPGIHGDSEYELYIKEDGTIGKRKRKKLTINDLEMEKSILDFAPEKVERKEPTSLGSGLPGGREEVEEEEVTSLGSGLPGGREEMEEEITSLGSGLPGGAEEMEEEVTSLGSGLPGGVEEEDEKRSSDTLDQLMLGDPPELPKSRSRSDFLINFGLDLATRSPKGNIFQTAAASAREPFKQFQQQAGQEDLLKYKHAQGERAFNLEIYKAMTDKDKHALQEKIDYLVDEFGLTPEEALNRALPEFRKSMSKEDAARQALESERDQIQKDAAATRAFLSKEEGESISIPQAIVINEFYDQAREKGWEYDTTPFIDKTAIEEEWRAAGKKQEDWISPEGNIAISPDEQSIYKEGLYYVDSFNGDVYKVGPGSTELIKIDLSEININ